MLCGLTDCQTIVSPQYNVIINSYAKYGGKGAAQEAKNLGEMSCGKGGGDVGGDGLVACQWIPGVEV